MTVFSEVFIIQCKSNLNRKLSSIVINSSLYMLDQKFSMGFNRSIQGKLCSQMLLIDALIAWIT